ncbi:MAG: M48 family metalloprotease [Bryobacteraceae bacterium]
MRPLVFIVGLILAAPLPGQFGGLDRLKGIGRAKDKINQAEQKAKPVTDRTQKAADAFTHWSDTEEQELGAAVAAKMVAVFGLLEDPALVRYVNLVGKGVAQFAPRQIPYRFAILDSDIVGAFAIPGGYIFITRAALSGMTNEAQLAGALGHEIVHVAERHLETEIRGGRRSAWAAEEARALASPGPAALRAKADAFFKEMVNMKLSREKEDGADERGTLMAGQAGYSAAGLLQFLGAMAAANSKPENQRMFGQLLSTHPTFEDRMASLTPVVSRSAKGGKTLESRFRSHVPAA